MHILHQESLLLADRQLTAGDLTMSVGQLAKTSGIVTEGVDAAVAVDTLGNSKGACSSFFCGIKNIQVIW
jgi:hypothetical protein